MKVVWMGGKLLQGPESMLESGLAPRCRCVQLSDILAGALAVKATMPNIRVILWSVKKARVYVLVM
jgi:hypothetical protein